MFSTVKHDLPQRRTLVIIALAVVASLALFGVIVAFGRERSDTVVVALLGIATTMATALAAVITRWSTDPDQDKADRD